MPYVKRQIQWIARTVMVKDNNIEEAMQVQTFRHHGSGNVIFLSLISISEKTELSVRYFRSLSRKTQLRVATYVPYVQYGFHTYAHGMSPRSCVSPVRDISWLVLKRYFEAHIIFMFSNMGGDI